MQPTAGQIRFRLKARSLLIKVIKNCLGVDVSFSPTN